MDAFIPVLAGLSIVIIPTAIYQWLDHRHQLFQRRLQLGAFDRPRDELLQRHPSLATLDESQLDSVRKVLREELTTQAKGERWFSLGLALVTLAVGAALGRIW